MSFSISDANAVFQKFAHGTLVSCAEVGGLSSSNYCVRESRGEQYVLKRAPPSYVRDFEEILASYAAFTAAGVPAIAPLAGHDGKWLQNHDHNTFVLFPFIEGRTLHQDTMTACALESSGSMLGRIHAVPCEGRREYASFLSHQQVMKQRLMHMSLATSPARDVIEDSLRAKAALHDMLEPRLAARVDRVVLHGDFHNENLLYGADDSVIGVIDLELSMVGDAGRDYVKFIDVTCCNTAFEADNLRMASTFLNAYRRVRPIDDGAFRASMASYLHDASQSAVFEAAIAVEQRNELIPYLERDLRKCRFYEKHLDEFIDAVWLEGA